MLTHQKLKACHQQNALPSRMEATQRPSNNLSAPVDPFMAYGFAPA